MATFLRTTGEREVLSPANGVNWSPQELETLVGGYLAVVGTIDGRYMVIDDHGKLKGKEPNAAATRLFVHGRIDVIAGEAVLIDTQLELDGPND